MKKRYLIVRERDTDWWDEGIYTSKKEAIEQARLEWSRLSKHDQQHSSITVFDITGLSDEDPDRYSNSVFAL